jgi:two-component system chemotaxis response regulator CheY
MPPSRHVLIVDDAAAVRTVLAHMLAQLSPDAMIVAAANGAEALSAVEAQHPDLIITDYQMPVMGGLEFVRTLRAQGLAMPIVALSSDASIADVILLAGANAFLSKPFRVSVFKDLLRSLLPDGEETRAIGQ